MSIWNSQSIQFVWFPKSVEHIDADQLYQSLVGQPPDNFQRSKAPSPRMPFLSLATGEFDNKSFTVQVNPARVDLIANATPNVDGDPDVDISIDTVGTIEYLLARVKAGSASSIKQNTRLAIAVHLIKQMPDLPASVSSIFESCDISMNADGYSDVNVQMNKRKVLDNGTSINRLIRFATEVHRAFTLSIDPSTGPQVSDIPVGSEKILSALHLDFNTIPDGNEIPDSSTFTILAQIADELIRVGSSARTSALEE